MFKRLTESGLKTIKWSKQSSVGIPTVAAVPERCLSNSPKRETETKKGPDVNTATFMKNLTSNVHQIPPLDQVKLSFSRKTESSFRINIHEYPDELKDFYKQTSTPCQKTETCVTLQAMFEWFFRCHTSSGESVLHALGIIRPALIPLELFCENLTLDELEPSSTSSTSFEVEEEVGVEEFISTWSIESLPLLIGKIKISSDTLFPPGENVSFEPSEADFKHVPYVLGYTFLGDRNQAKMTVGVLTKEGVFHPLFSNDLVDLNERMDFSVNVLKLLPIVKSLSDNNNVYNNQ